MPAAFIFAGLNLLGGLQSNALARQQARLNYQRQQIDSTLQAIELSRERTEKNIAETRRIAKIRVALGAGGYSGGSQAGAAISQGVYDYNRDKQGDNIALLAIQSQKSYNTGTYRVKKKNLQLDNFNNFLKFGTKIYNAYGADDE